MPKEIPLTQGEIAIVDDDMYDYLMQWKWCVSRSGSVGRRKADPYAVRREKGTTSSIRMHRVVAGALSGEQVDHINGNTLDNRRENLRRCTDGQNKRNMGGWTNSDSGHKGVAWNKALGKWVASITKDYKSIHIGVFDDKLEAARAYNEAAKFFFGEYARLNDVPDCTPCRITQEVLRERYSFGTTHRINNTSGFIGVSWHKYVRQWKAGINFGGGNIHIAYSDDVQEAAYIRDQVALQLHGDRAKLNLLTGPSIPLDTGSSEAYKERTAPLL
jgi:hypothetical protein